MDFFFLFLIFFNSTWTATSSSSSASSSSTFLLLLSSASSSNSSSESTTMIDSDSNKRPFSHDPTTISASVVFKPFQIPLFSSTNDGAISPCHSIRLHADHPYTVGRRLRDCDFIFHDRRVSKQNCQIFFNASLCKLYILSGVLSLNDSTTNTNTKPCLVHEFRKTVMTSRGSEGFQFREASNGVFVNGVEIRKGMAVELTEGDRVSLVCGNQNGLCGIGIGLGRIVFEGCDYYDDNNEIDGLTLSGHSQSGKRSKRFLL